MAFGDIVQSNGGTIAGVSSFSATLGSAITAGNLVVVMVTANNVPSGANTGWTKSTGMSPVSNAQALLWWFKAVGGDTIPTVTFASATTAAWRIVEYAGPFDASPYLTSAGTATNGPFSSATSPAITPTAGSRALLIAGLGGQTGDALWNVASVTLGSFTNSYVNASQQFRQASIEAHVACQVSRVIASASGSYSTTGAFSTTTNSAGSCRVELGIAFKAGATNVTVAVTGQAATASVGAVTATGKQNVSTTVGGQAVTAGVGTVIATGSQNVSTIVGGQEVTASVGTVSVVQGLGVTVPVASPASTAFVGNASVSAGGAITVGVASPTMTAEVGSVTVIAEGAPGVCIPAFQADAFQFDAFQTCVDVQPPVPIPVGGGDGGGGRKRKERRWIRGAPYPWEKDEEEAEKKVRKRVTVELVDEALDELGQYEGLPGWWELQNPKVVKQHIPDYVWVPAYEAEDHQAVLAAIMTKIAEDAERDDEEAILLLLS